MSKSVKKLDNLTSHTFPFLFCSTSADPKFRKLVKYALESEGCNGEIAMIGFHPHTHEPLNMGVSTVLQAKPSSMPITFLFYHCVAHFQRHYSLTRISR
jgi:hypothetical protein